MDYEPGTEPRMTAYLGIDGETGDLDFRCTAHQRGPGHSYVKIQDPRVAFAVNIWLDADGTPHAEVSDSIGYARP